MNGHAEPTDSYIQQNAVKFSDVSVPKQLLKNLEGKELLLIGEQHGTSEFPEYAGSIVEALSENQPVALGVEFPKDLQPVIDQFLATGDESLLHATHFFQDSNYHSGRGSVAMVALLKKMRSLHLPVFCFDIADGAPYTTRDTDMAANILEYMNAHPGTMIVTYSGNVHSRLMNGFPGVPDHINMGAEVLRLAAGKLTLTNATNLNFVASQGNIWNCMPDANSPQGYTCESRKVGPDLGPYSRANKWQRYYLKEKDISEGHANTVFIRTISASLPF
jgi:hypothetical protein